MKDDEQNLLTRLQGDARLTPQGNVRLTPLEVAEQIGMNVKRLEYICQKWLEKGWLECGTSARTGWLTEAGKAAKAE